MGRWSSDINILLVGVRFFMWKDKINRKISWFFYCYMLQMSFWNQCRYCMGSLSNSCEGGSFWVKLRWFEKSFLSASSLAQFLLMWLRNDHQSHKEKQKWNFADLILKPPIQVAAASAPWELRSLKKESCWNAGNIWSNPTKPGWHYQEGVPAVNFNKQGWGGRRPLPGL